MSKSAASIDTCTFRVDRSAAIEPAEIILSESRCEVADTGETTQPGSTAKTIDKLLLESFLDYRTTLSFPRKRESSFFAVYSCFRSGDPPAADQFRLSTTDT